MRHFAAVAMLGHPGRVAGSQGSSTRQGRRVRLKQGLSKRLLFHAATPCCSGPINCGKYRRRLRPKSGNSITSSDFKSGRQKQSRILARYLPYIFSRCTFRSVMYDDREHVTFVCIKRPHLAFDDDDKQPVENESARSRRYPPRASEPYDEILNHPGLRHFSDFRPSHRIVCLAA